MTHCEWPQSVLRQRFCNCENPCTTTARSPICRTGLTSHLMRIELPSWRSNPRTVGVGENRFGYLLFTTSVRKSFLYLEEFRCASSTSTPRYPGEEDSQARREPLWDHTCGS